MTTKEYDNDSPATMASESSLAYASMVTTPAIATAKGSMTVEEYFNKVRKALDKRYENL